VVNHGGVLIMGYRNVPGRLPVDASSLYARNLFNFVSTYADKDAGDINLDWDDELVVGTGLTRSGEIVHPSFKQEA
jgi:NAD(P) transhydrogenase subunit alpha